MNHQEEYFEDSEGMRHDPKEKDPKYRDIINKAVEEAESLCEKECPKMKGELGWCHIVWDRQKRILKEKYNLDWKTPAEMNTDTLFD